MTSPTRFTEAEIAVVTRAVADPGAVVGMRLVGETITRWQARAALAALDKYLADSGSVILPREATEAMIEATWAMRSYGDHGGLEREDAAEEYRAMRDAALGGKG
jgi:hypothetical protein